MRTQAVTVTDGVNTLGFRYTTLALSASSGDGNRGSLHLQDELPAHPPLADNR